MIRSLRLRFFLITWPLIVLAVASVALAFDRWTEVRLTALQEVRSEPVPEALRLQVDRLGTRWASGRITDSLLRAAIAELARNASVDLVLVDLHGRIAAARDPKIRLQSSLDTLPGSGPLGFVQTSEQGNVVSQQLIRVAGSPVMTPSGEMLGRAYLLPVAGRRAENEPRPQRMALRGDARRTLWTAVLVASGVAAILALLLSGPLVRQVTRLADAATRVGQGDLAARVTVGGSDELGRTELAFNQMAAALEAAKTHQRNLMNDVAHELRTPLTNIVGTLEAIEDGLRDANVTTLGTLRTEAGLLVALVNDLQELSLAESGQLRFELVQVDVVDAARATVDAMRAGAGMLRLEGPVGGPVYARADARRLDQILRNLLQNAITNTPAGGLVGVEVELRGSEVRVSVVDTGRGIPARHMSSVWQRFYRVDLARGRAAGGRGLGLAIVKQFAEGMAGRVSASSVEGQGSTFEIWLPAATDEQLLRT